MWVRGGVRVVVVVVAILVALGPKDFNSFAPDYFPPHTRVNFVESYGV